MSKEKKGGQCPPLSDIVNLNLPTNGRSAQHGSRSTVETADQELSLALENIHDAGLVGFLDGLHNQVASLYHATEEDVGLRAGEGGEVGTGLAQHLNS